MSRRKHFLPKFSAKSVAAAPLDVTTKQDAKPVIKEFVILNESAVLSSAELAALKQGREADPEKCPRCCMGYAGGLGYNAAKDRCQACGFSGKREATVAK